MKPELLVEFVRELYRTNDFIPLHAPSFNGNEGSYVMEAIDSTFVSSIGKFVDDFEARIEAYTSAPKAIATVNGTAALHTALYAAGVIRGDVVITQALTFVATCNALYHMGVKPAFVDVSPTSLGLCPKALEMFLEEYAILKEGGSLLKETGQRIKAVVPMHTFGHPVELDELAAVCQKWNLTLIEDAAESLGSLYKGRHTGTIGEFGAISFNGNKIITTGGGGMVLCSSKDDGDMVKHITTTSKVPHSYEFFHDEPGFNYRMPNLNAALGCAQMEVLDKYLVSKRNLAEQYEAFFKTSGVDFFREPAYARSNYWLNAVVCEDEDQKFEILDKTNAAGVMTRPVWRLMNTLPMYQRAPRGDLSQAEYLSERIVNLPSSVNL